MLNQKQRDAITEIVNIGVGKGSATLSNMVSTEIILHVPYVNVISFDQIRKEFEQMNVDQVHAVELQFLGEYEGMANIILSTESASHLASAVTHEPEGTESFEQMKDGVLIEVGNIILNAVMGSFGNILNIPFNYEIPRSFEGDILGLYEQLDEQHYREILICRTNFDIRGKAIEGEIFIIYEINSFEKLKVQLDALMA